MELDEAENFSLQTFKRNVPGSARSEDAIHDLFCRGFTYCSHERPQQDPALLYYSRITHEAERQGLECGKVMHLYDGMVFRWRKAVAAHIGSTIREPARLSVVLDEFVTHAEVLGGADVDPGLKSTLHNAIASVLGAAPSASRPAILPPEAATAAACEPNNPPHQQSNDSDDMLGGVSFAAMASPPAHEKPFGANDSTHKHEEAMPATPEAFFLQHAVKMKRKLRKNIWRQTGIKQKAQEEAQAEFRKLDMNTAAQWTDLFRKASRGDKSLLRSKAVAHLFHGGCARALWTSEGNRNDPDEPMDAASAVATPGPSLPPRTSTAIVKSRETAQPPTLASFKPTRQQYEHVRETERTVFMQLPFGFRVPLEQIIDSCCQAIGVGNTPAEVNHRDCTIRKEGLCVIRFKNLKPPRLLIHQAVDIHGKSLRAWPYPEQSPQVYYARINHRGPQGVRIDAVPVSIANVVTIPFHILKEPIGDDCSRPTAWIVVFRGQPSLIRFTVGVQRHDGRHTRVSFEPVSSSSACLICNCSHAAYACDLLDPASREELGIASDNLRYLNKLPKIR
ncbi:hypothetical protein LTR37_001498 [Vermiconidia calcicola]|uniref:Uncharacterized protein n=1 Tax=Vermiconidia calcicola TaxID=1690605 RepID=A0ACC3NWN9_9PEZI|nr:hypothetical protein LTR37_001498 [Vermiconidia calcicola]